MKRIITIMLLAFAIQSFAQNFKISERKDIHHLELKNEKRDIVSTTYNQITSFSVDPKQIFKYQIKEFDAFKSEGLYESGNPGEPTTYLMSKKVILPNNAVVKAVRLIEGNFIEVQDKLNLVPVKELQLWNGSKKSMTWNKNENIYNKDENFPGKSATFLAGSNGKNTIVNVKFFPIQFNPFDKKVYIITDAKFEISYDLKTAENKASKNIKSIPSENIILTTSQLVEAADSLKSLHEISEGVSTSVVTTGWIDANYNAAENPTNDGYANITNNPVSNNYDYDLAKKIISYLNDTEAHPNLVNITILGDALLVPPSYYFYENWMGDSYTDWIGSDVFYSSPDYDFTLNYQVGRLPVNTIEEANHIVSKLKTWKANLSADWFHNTNIIGGVPFETSYLIGEVITLDAVNHSYFQGKNITKNFSTNGTETRSAVLPIFSDENTGMIFHIGHGSGSSIALEQGSVSYNDMMALPPKEKFPILVSIACMNGGYDTELMDNAPFNNAFSEGVLKSQAGGIAYWGGIRSNAGAPNVSFMDDGEWIIGDEPLMAKMLTNLFKAYAEGNNTFGSINNTAFTEYMDVMNPNDEAQWATAFEFVFLGDPALSILPQQPENISSPSMDVSPSADISGGANPPVYEYSAIDSLKLSFTATTNSESINQKTFTISELGETSILNSNTLTQPNFLYEYELLEKNNFMLAYEASNFKETRMYFNGDMAANVAPSSSRMFDVQNQSGNNYDLKWSKSIDIDGIIDSYTLFEGKNPSVIVDELNNTSNWEYEKFFMTSCSEPGHSQTSCLMSFPLNNANGFIETNYSVDINQGDNLEFNIKYDIENNQDFLYAQIAEAGKEFQTVATYTGSNGGWEHQAIDLSDYVGKQVKFKFAYQTNEQNLGSGIYLDDISLVKTFESTRHIENITDTSYSMSGNSTAIYQYAVRAVDNNGAKSQLSNMISVDVENIGIKKKDVSNSLAIHPNPAKDILNIYSPEKATINLYNIVGQNVLSQQIYVGKSKVNITHLERGCYFMKIDGINFKTVQKIVLN